MSLNVLGCLPTETTPHNLPAVQIDVDTFDSTALLDFQRWPFSLTYGSASLAFVLP